jgi:acyl carrier protein
MKYDHTVLSTLTRTLLAEILGMNSLDDVQPESHLADDLGLDSLDAVEMVMAFEEEFDIEIEDADAEKFERVQDIIDYLVRELLEPTE